MRFRRIIIASAPACIAAALTCCAAEERVVGMDSMLSGLQGSESQLPLSSRGGVPRSQAIDTVRRRDNQDARQRVERNPGEAAGPVDPRNNPLREETEDGAIKLLSFAPRHLVTHLRQTLLNEEYDLLYEQLISDRTKQEYEERDRDPLEARAWFQRHRRDVLRLLAKMPMGEQTPGLYMRNVGNGVYRLQLPNRADSDFQRLDFVWERGVCRLVLIS